MFTYKEVIDITLGRIDEIDGSDQVQNMVKSAINDAYINELAKQDKRITSTIVPVINGIATLPDDLDTIESISPSLSFGERKIGNAIISKQTSPYTIIYSYIREPLINDTDEVDMTDKYKFLLSTYSCYIYYQYRRKESIANMFLQEYQLGLSKLTDDDNFGEESINDIYETTSSEVIW